MGVKKPFARTVYAVLIARWTICQPLESTAEHERKLKAAVAAATHCRLRRIFFAGINSRRRRRLLGECRKHWYWPPSLALVCFAFPKRDLLISSPFLLLIFAIGIIFLPLTNNKLRRVLQRNRIVLIKYEGYLTQ